MWASLAKTLRHAVRDVLILLAVVLTCPLWLPVRLVMLFSAKDGFFYGCSQLLSLFPGTLGVFLRRGFYVMCLQQFAHDCHIEFGTCIPHLDVRIGRGVYIAVRCIVASCEIGDYALIGSNVDILDGRYQHRFDDPAIPICDQPGTLMPVRIGRNTWIGNSSVIMADVGEDCVIGAGSVVVKPIPPSSVAAGNPATIKKSRLAT
jgi:acetyltransferase-like isoleucine patch superfamily enzyme